MDNRTIADHLLQQAHRLMESRDNLYRIRAYRRAASTVLSLDQPLQALVQVQGLAGLEQLPGIGRRLARRLEALALDRPAVESPFPVADSA